ncbi:MAG: DUF2971 domain-containing protein [Muribaculaceae bacterium]|nr:DUF2971 domain-containing protein [Muribaculaceae bacterium]
MNNPLERQDYSLFHYTNLNALISILRSECIVLWATNAAYLNDPTELKQGIAIVNELENSHFQFDDFKNIYLTSFSNNADSLVMWSQYGAHGNGCSIGISSKAIGNSYGQFCRCCYGREETEQHLKNTLSLIDNGIISTFGLPKPSEEIISVQRKLSRQIFLQTTCVMSKDTAYKHENETRAFVEVPQEHYKQVQFRLVDNRIVPYVQMQLDKEALTDIVIGPTLNADITERSIKQMLEIRGYDLSKINIKFSEVPFRG